MLKSLALLTRRQRIRLRVGLAAGLVDNVTTVYIVTGASVCIASSSLSVVSAAVVLIDVVRFVFILGVLFGTAC